MSEFIDLKNISLIDTFNSLGWQLWMRKIWRVKLWFQLQLLLPQLSRLLRLVTYLFKYFFMWDGPAASFFRLRIKYIKIKKVLKSRFVYFLLSFLFLKNMKSQNVCQKSKKKEAETSLSWSLMILELYETLLTLFLFNQYWEFFPIHDNSPWFLIL